MDEHRHEEKETHYHKKNMTDKLRENPWIISTIVLGVLVLVILLTNLPFGLTGKTISKQQAGENLVEYLSSVGYAGFSVTNVEDSKGFYLINTDYQGEKIPFYVTKNGYIVGNSLISIIPLEDTTSQDSEIADIPKSDKPVVELFIWAYCPYGVQAQAPMAEVANLLKNNAEFDAILYYDGHGAHETEQNKIQACIQKIAKDKYWDYASGFVETIYSNCGATKDAACDKTESIKLMKSLGIDSTKVMSCVSSEGETLTEAYSQYANQLGVTGSPTIIINGVKANVARDAESIKTAVCSAFTDAPAECDLTLSSGSATASGNC